MSDPTNTAIRVDGFVLHSAGDPSVGIPSSDWTISGEMFFEEKEDLEEFRKSLRETFQFVCDGAPKVMTFEEYQSIIDAEDRAFAPFDEPEPEPEDPLLTKAKEFFPDLTAGNFQEKRDRRIQQQAARAILKHQ